MDRTFRIAELEQEPEALEQIRRLEERLSELKGTDIALIAYSASEENGAE